MKLLDEFLARPTRIRALETALVAHAMLNTDRLPEQRITLSAAAACVLDVIVGQPAAARVALVSVISIAVQWEPGPLQLDALRLAQDAATLSVQDLASIGTMRQVLDLLAAEYRSLRDVHPRARAA